MFNLLCYNCTVHQPTPTNTMNNEHNITPKFLAGLSYAELSVKKSQAKKMVKKIDSIRANEFCKFFTRDMIKRLEISKASFEMDLTLMNDEINNRAEMIPFSTIEKMLAE